MSFLAIKGKGICAFNNTKEKEELEDLFSKEKSQIFLNEEKEKAIRFAGVNKIFGFLIEQDLINFRYIKKLENDGCYAIHFMVKGNDHFCSVLNDTYYISTNKRLDWIPSKRCFKEGAYYGHEDYFVEDFEQSIINYMTDTHQSIEQATLNYLMNFKLFYHYYPWKVLLKTDIKQIDDEIQFGVVCDTIARDMDEVKLVMKRRDLLICDSNITSISIKDIPRRIKNEAITDVIRNNIWL